MAMTPELVSSHFPYLPIHLTVRITQTTIVEQELEALLDTGFDGDVVVPANFHSNGHPPEAYVTWALADGSEVVAPIFPGTLSFEGFPLIPVAVTALGNEPLIGRRAITGVMLTLDHGVRVIVNP